MAHGGNWIVVSYNGQPDLWSTKPPLMIWLQAVCIRLFGLNELSVRLPSAMAAFATCAVIFIFCFKYLKRIELGFISVLVLITTGGYIANHVTRTGDYDSLLVLLTTTYLLCFFIFIETENLNRAKKFLLYFFIAVTLAALAKGLQGLIFLPALLIYSLARKKFLFVLKQKNFYTGAILFSLFVFGYFLLREILSPGFLNAFWNMEGGGRFNQPIDGHRGSFTFYLNILINEDFSRWYLFVPCGIIIGLVQMDKRLKNLCWFLLLVSAEYLFVISSAQTKINWYDAPLFPLLALIVGVFLSWFYNAIRNHEGLNRGLKFPVVAFVALFLLFVTPYTQTIQNIFNYEEISWNKWVYDIPNYLNRAVTHDKNIDGAKVVYNYFPATTILYIKMLEEKNQHVTLKLCNVEDKFLTMLKGGSQPFTLCNTNDIIPGDKLIVNESAFISEVETKYNVQYLEDYDNVKVLQIISLIQSDSTSVTD